MAFSPIAQHFLLRYHCLGYSQVRSSFSLTLQFTEHPLNSNYLHQKLLARLVVIVVELPLPLAVPAPLGALLGEQVGLVVAPDALLAPAVGLHVVPLHGQMAAVDQIVQFLETQSIVMST